MITWVMIALMTRRLTQPGELSDAHLACRLTCSFLLCLEGEFPLGCFPDVVQVVDAHTPA